ncbi:MAG: glycosyltransferase [Campylobacterota bacterium]|nr:glycosyltransferase [Campylobacterota bacterium]
MYNLSVIIPIKITSKTMYILNRLKSLIKFFDNFNIEVVISDATVIDQYKNIIKEYIKNFDKIVYINKPIKGIYSASICRNNGVEFSTSDYLLFFDVDLVPNNQLIKQFFIDIKNIEENKFKFLIYPCLYLSKYYTDFLATRSNLFDEEYFHIANKSFQEGNNIDVLYNAINTSTILVSRELFINIGMFDNSFSGHGYEDFELIHRLFIFENQQTIGKDYFTDYKTPLISEYRGFRKYFLIKTLPMYLSGIFTMHLYHSRPLNLMYYKNRIKNFEYFMMKIKENINYAELNETEHIQLNEMPKNIKGFYEVISHVDKKNNYKKKLRKLARSPLLFFIDFIKNKLRKIKTIM